MQGMTFMLMVFVFQIIGLENNMDIKCSECNRYLGKAQGTVVAQLKCPNSKCKATTNIKITNEFSAETDTHFIFKEKTDE